MGVISTEMYDELLLAHVPEDKAKAAAAEVARSQDVASKSDVLELGAHLRILAKRVSNPKEKGQRSGRKESLF